MKDGGVIIQNYHKHTSWSNVFVSDCTASYEDYIKRAKELGHKVISSVEHGYQSNYYVPYELVQKIMKPIKSNTKQEKYLKKNMNVIN